MHHSLECHWCSYQHFKFYEYLMNIIIYLCIIIVWLQIFFCLNFSVERCRTHFRDVFWFQDSCRTLPKGDAAVYRRSAGWRTGNVAQKTSRTGTLQRQCVNGWIWWIIVCFSLWAHCGWKRSGSFTIYLGQTSKYLLCKQAHRVQKSKSNLSKSWSRLLSV